MGKVVFDISMSLDGYMTAANRTPAEPTGEGGQRLTEWAMGSDRKSRRFLEEAIERLGATICGRTTYDTSLPWWGADGPSGPARRPVFVVTHRPADDSPQDGVYAFVTDGIESALEQAQVAAGDADVTIMGGASIGRQYIAAGLVDEISIHLVPVLFDGGTRMFDELGTGHIHLEPIEVIEAPLAIHQRFRVIGRSHGAATASDG
jgi:dihydrofolate reductase